MSIPPSETLPPGIYLIRNVFTGGYVNVDYDDDRRLVCTPNKQEACSQPHLSRDLVIHYRYLQWETELYDLQPDWYPPEGYPSEGYPPEVDPPERTVRKMYSIRLVRCWITLGLLCGTFNNTGIETARAAHKRRVCFRGEGEA